jgi:hypothetical protein
VREATEAQRLKSPRLTVPGHRESEPRGGGDRTVTKWLPCTSVPLSAAGPCVLVLSPGRWTLAFDHANQAPSVPFLAGEDLRALHLAFWEVDFHKMESRDALSSHTGI